MSSDNIVMPSHLQASIKVQSAKIAIFVISFNVFCGSFCVKNKLLRRYLTILILTINSRQVPLAFMNVTG